MNDSTCSVAMKGIQNHVSLGILIFVKFLSFSRSKAGTLSLFSVKRSATEEKYSFILFAIFIDEVICSLFIISSSGKLLLEALVLLLTVRKYFQIVLESLRFLTDSVKCLRLACRISSFVLFRYLLNEKLKMTELLTMTVYPFTLTFTAPNKNCSRRHFSVLLLSFEENKV